MRGASPPVRAARIKALAARVLAHAAVGRVLQALYTGGVPMGKARVHVPPSDPEATAAVFWGLYESAERRFVRQYLPPDLDVVELGSHLGAVALSILERLDPGRRLLCVEANPSIVPWLERNLGPYRETHEVDIVTAAVDYTGAEAVRLVADGTPQGSAVNHDTTAGVPVRPTRVRDLAVVRAGRPWALVCDIEGAEAGVIIADAAALAQCQICIAEFHATTYDGVSYTPEDLAVLLESRTSLRRRAQHGPVYVFTRGA